MNTEPEQPSRRYECRDCGKEFAPPPVRCECGCVRFVPVMDFAQNGRALRSPTEDKQMRSSQAETK